MANINSKNNIKELTISATIIRADGKVENLGEISYHHQSLLKRLLWNIKQKLRR